MKKKHITLLLLCLSTLSFAQTFQNNGIYYTIIDTMNFYAEVGNNPGFKGVANIPSTVTYNNQSYKVKSIGDYAFYNCSRLISINIPNLVTNIGAFALGNCNAITSITIPNSVTSIGRGAFGGCENLTSVNIPNSITSISGSVFTGCQKLTSVTIPNSIKSIGDNAFSNCTKLTSITIPSSVTSIGDSAFFNCYGLTSITIPNSVTNIVSYAFAYCTGLKSVNIPNSITKIDSSVFSGCSGLTSISIPSSITSIEDYAFSNCTKLTSIECAIASPLFINSNVFQYVNQNACTLNVPSGTRTAYQAAPVWQDFNPINDGTLASNSFVKDNFTIYPIPAKDFINIAIENNLQLEKVTIYNLLGQVVKTGNTTVISTNDLTKGTYFTEVVTTQGKASKQIVVE
ncbi:leucine-rich repeat protein [Flavobacterium davisii]|uniref:leucine-rich repeat protein n=1 Tax=Flavobacterium davisii TaxID=2906077 RepID=UPI0035CFC24D